MPALRWFKKLETEHLALAAVMALALCLRLWDLGTMEFKLDESNLVNQAASVLNGSLPLVGLRSSTGVFNPAFAVYFIALPAAFSRDPLVITGFVAVFNLLGVYLCYRLGRTYWNARVGLLAAVLFAISPWAVFYARKIWAQDLLPPFTLLFMHSTLDWLVRRRRWALTGAIVWLVCLTQIHLSTVVLIPLIGVGLLATWRRTHWPALAAGLGLALLLYAPYLAFEIAHGWENVRLALQLIGGQSQWSLQSFQYALLNVGGRGIHALTGSAHRAFLETLPPLFWLDCVEEGVAVLGLIYALWTAWRRPERRVLAVLMVTWALVPPLLYVYHATPVYPHYVILLYPVQYLLVAWVVDDGLRWAQARSTRGVGTAVRLAVAAGLAVLLAWQVTQSVALYHFVSTHDTPGAMGTPLRVYRQMQQQLTALTRTLDNPQFVLVSPGDHVYDNEMPSLFTALAGRDLQARPVDGAQAILLPSADRDSLVVVAPGADPQAVALVEHYAQELPGTRIYTREAKEVFRFFRLPAEARSALAAPWPAPAASTFANGVSILGYGVSGGAADGLLPASHEAGQTEGVGETAGPGRTVRLFVYWTVGTPPPAPRADYHFFNHLLDTTGVRQAQRDGVAYPSRLWSDGDGVIAWFDLQVTDEAPAPPYVVRTGLYTYPDIAGVPLVDAAGQPIGDAVEFRLP